MYLCTVCIYVCIYVCMYACMHVCMFACMHVCMLCMYACMHVWMYVCTYVCSQNRHANTMSTGEWQWPVLAACAMWPSSARWQSWERTVCCRRLANAEGWRPSFAEVPGRSGKSDSNNTHGQLNDDSLVSWRNKSFRRGNQYQWQLQQTHRNMFNRHAAREHLPYLGTCVEDHMQCHVIWLLEAFFLRRRARYQNCLASTASLVAATRDFRTTSHHASI